MTSYNPAPIETSEAILPSKQSTGTSTTAEFSATPQSGNGIPPSVVADVDYPNVQDTTESQQAATAPGAGGVVEEKLPFKEQVNGYAKKFAGSVFRNKDEKEFGEKKLQGEI
ncbi:hypothetical protein BCR39DRAFT_541508 [Naematelia encephala]|uniref:Uncharacterized protein n=1 Tax=Naematelia encephala TaxID=71784 RepID=A0A1Y2AUF4_9TREE|nr:hypothetical protein BCR39DRAFT_541508 [Naematelia encephala]